MWEITFWTHRRAFLMKNEGKRNPLQKGHVPVTVLFLQQVGHFLDRRQIWAMTNVVSWWECPNKWRFPKNVSIWWIFVCKLGKPENSRDTFRKICTWISMNICIQIAFQWYPGRIGLICDGIHKRSPDRSCFFWKSPSGPTEFTFDSDLASYKTKQPHHPAILVECKK